MATGTYRQIYLSFWRDPFVLDLPIKEKYFYLYLITNEFTNICGIYELSIKIASLHLNLSEKEILQLIKKFEEYGKIKYSLKTGEICVRNFLRYNSNKSPKTLAGVVSLLKEVKSKELIPYLNGLKELNIYPVDIVSNQEIYPIDTICTDTVTETVSDTVTETDADILLGGGEDSTPTTPAEKLSPTQKTQQEQDVFIALILNDKTEYLILKQQIREWRELYPAVDVEQELREMRGWLDANPKKRKTIQGIKRFINSWLSREQDKGGSSTSPNMTQQTPRNRNGGDDELEIGFNF